MDWSEVFSTSLHYIKFPFSESYLASDKTCLYDSGNESFKQRAGEKTPRISPLTFHLTLLTYQGQNALK